MLYEQLTEPTCLPGNGEWKMDNLDKHDAM